MKQLTNMVQQLQDQIGILEGNQTDIDHRYVRMKQENQTLLNKAHMLEDQVNSLEESSKDDIEVEQKYHKDVLKSIERERQLEIESFTLKLELTHREKQDLGIEVNGLKHLLESLHLEKKEVEDQLTESRSIIAKQQEETKYALQEKVKAEEKYERDRRENKKTEQDVSRELEEVNNVEGEPDNANIVTNLLGRITEMEAEVKILRDENKDLKHVNEDLQGRVLNKGVEEGLQLLQANGPNTSPAEEIGDMSETQEAEQFEIMKVKRALIEQQEENSHLRNYIDNVLLGIMDKYPELLEIRK